MDETNKLIEQLFDRVESEGVATAQVKDGRLLVLKRAVLERLLQDVMKSENGTVVLFIKDPSLLN